MHDYQGRRPAREYGPGGPAVAGLPPIYCPIEPAIHPAAGRVERRALAWLDRFGFCARGRERARAVATRAADFYARFTPGAGEERLLTAANWVYWAFAFDDAFCDRGPLSERPAEFVSLAARLQRTLEIPGPAVVDDPWGAALSDLGAQLRGYGTAVQFQRFAQAHRAWLFGVAWQVGNRSRAYRPTFDEYVTMRLHSAGGEPIFALVEIANGAEVPAHEMDAPAVRALTEMAILVAALDNDRVSYRKEVQLGEGDQNVFAVVAGEARCSPREAGERVVAIRDRVMTRFLELRERVLRDASTELRRYLTDLGHGIRGNAEWGLRVPRYLGVGRARDAIWADRPADARRTPPPIPSIHWWWDTLA